MMRTFLFMVLFAVSVTFASDWPQWLGPNFNCISNETDLPDSLDPNSMLWKTPLAGPGEATPAIVGDAVYLSGYNKDRKELFAVCIDAKTGKQRWSNVAGTFEKFPNRNILASPSPVADESGAIFLYSDGTLVKYAPDGDQLWKRNLVEDYGPFKSGWGYSSSPLLYDNRLYVQVLRSPEPPSGYTGSMASYLLVMDPATGKTLYKADRPTDATGDHPDAYTTPVPATIDGQKQIIVFGGDYLTGHDPATGQILFRCKYLDYDLYWGRAAATPTVDDGVLYCPLPSGSQMRAYDLSKLAANNPNDPGILWKLEEPICDVPCPVAVNGCLYFITDNKKTLTCLDAKTGTKQWTGQLDKSDTHYASITAADGNLYMVNRKGVVTVVAIDSKEFRIVSTHDFGENPVDSTIAVAAGKLYLKTAENLYCFGKRK